jgi:transcriptional regulator with XRE-family HTH domain
MYCKEGGSLKDEYEVYYQKFGLNVVYYRKREHLTQLQLAELVDVDRSHISAIELGKVGVSFDVLFRLCKELNITPKELFDFRD